MQHEVNLLLQVIDNALKKGVVDPHKVNNMRQVVSSLMDANKDKMLHDYFNDNFYKLIQLIENKRD